jgi:O6-methylguanine-DNA--protein-cysteine methyltransferase
MRKQNNHEVRYTIRRGDLAKFQENLTTLLDEKHGTSNREGETEDLDLQMSNKVRESKDIEQTIDDFYEAIKTACENTFRRLQATGKTTTNRSIPWWKGELTATRKRTNAFRRRFQRTRNESLREQRKTRYLEEKARYEATIKSEKLRSWKAYCNVATSSNPWNEVYKIAAGKTRTYTPLTARRFSNSGVDRNPTTNA